MQAALAILLILAQVASSLGVATCAFPAVSVPERSCCCAGGCACPAGSCCVDESTRPAAPAPSATSQPSLENEWASLLPAVALLLNARPEISPLPPAAFLAPPCPAAVPVYCRDCAFLI